MSSEVSNEVVPGCIENMEPTEENLNEYSWNLLPGSLQNVLPPNYMYLIQQFTELSPYQTKEDFEIPQFEVNMFVNVTTIEDTKL